MASRRTGRISSRHSLRNIKVTRRREREKAPSKGPQPLLRFGRRLLHGYTRGQTTVLVRRQLAQKTGEVPAWTKRL
jgi:hypothetical protein